MEKARALDLLRKQIERLAVVKSFSRGSEQFKKWHRDTEVVIENIFGADSRNIEDFRKVSYSLFVASNRTPEYKFEQAFQKGMDSARAVLQSLVDEVEEFWELPEPGGKGEPAKAPLGAMNRVIQLCERFHLVAKQLRDRHDDRTTLEVEDEYDVQDLLHALLRIDFDDVRAEEWTPSYAGGASRVDFLLKAESIVVEVKKTRKGLGEKQLGEQLLIDVARYRVHPDCKSLVCFVYDPEGRIGNPAGLAADINKAGGSIDVRMVVAPTGR